MCLFHETSNPIMIIYQLILMCIGLIYGLLASIRWYEYIAILIIIVLIKLINNKLIMIIAIIPLILLILYNKYKIY